MSKPPNPDEATVDRMAAAAARAVRRKWPRDFPEAHAEAMRQTMRDLYAGRFAADIEPYRAALAAAEPKRTP